ISSSIEYLLWFILHHPFSGVPPREADERLKSGIQRGRLIVAQRREEFDRACPMPSQPCKSPNRS
ncbi:MAG: hypothetical protein CO096_21340, partial [Armatimonadetes bacterium CG_4_9_14_3_um_filter_66_14]